jgi:glycosyltransferase involved in cell wall biosynthesis
MSEPLITVIIATYNCGTVLQRCLDSFAAQTYARKELVVIDGASTDNSMQVIEANSARIAYRESETDSGIYHAWNKALKHAKGDWIYFMGGDDRFLSPDVLKEMAAVLSGAFPEHRVVYGRVNVVRNDGFVIMTAGGPWDRKKFLQVMTLPHQGVFHHRSLFEVHGVFDESLRIAGDYEMLLRELKDRSPLFVPEIVVSDMGFGGSSSNYTHSFRTLNDIYRARRKHHIPDFPGTFYWVYFKALVRRFLTVTAGEEKANKAGNLYRRLTGRNPV